MMKVKAPFVFQYSHGGAIMLILARCGKYFHNYGLYIHASVWLGGEGWIPFKSWLSGKHRAIGEGWR